MWQDDDGQADCAKCGFFGKYGLIEVKTGGETLVAKGTKAHNELAKKIDTTKMPKPSFKMVLTADGDFAYRTKDGVVVCPIGCLKPSMIGKEL